jgi:hypothetical protein
VSGKLIYDNLSKKQQKIVDKMLKIAEKYKKHVTEKQYEVLKQNVFELDKTKILNKYRGCGSGWIEIDKDGEIVDLKYFIDRNVKIVGDIIDKYMPYIKLREDVNIATSSGVDEQNIMSFSFENQRDFKPAILGYNKHIRLIVNFSRHNAIRL